MSIRKFLEHRRQLSELLAPRNRNCAVVEDVDDFWTFVRKFESKKSQLEDYLHEKNQYLNLQLYASKNRAFHRNILSDREYAELFALVAFYLQFVNCEKLQRVKRLRKSQASLPIARFRDTIVTAIERSPVVIIAGDTGCGKSTQVPQFLYEAGYGKVACTQPRRIACISLAKRVSCEMLAPVRSPIVAYQIRFERTTMPTTRILFVTEALLLRQLSDEKALSNYDVIIIDEVHERHLFSDFLLGVMKCFLHAKFKLKLVIMSATINTQLFVNYFKSENCEFIQIPGKMYHVDIVYRPLKKHPLIEKKMKFDPSPYLEILNMIEQKYSKSQRGDVLIFVPGQFEINAIVNAIENSDTEKNWIVLPLHSSLSISEQEKVFCRCDDGYRKCIISTNIAETSVTIDGIRFVIDSGRVNKMKFDRDYLVNVLNEENISKDSARQRCGRAGRTGPGVCYRLYSETDFGEFESFTLAEIHSVSLESLILQMGSFGISNLINFPFLENPDRDSIAIAFDRLQRLNCVTGDLNKMSLTLLGDCLSQLPVELSIGLMLVNGTLFNLVNTVLILTSLLSIQSPYINKNNRNDEFFEHRESFRSNDGDLFTLMNIFTEWLRLKYEKDYDDETRSSKGWSRKIGIEEQRFYEIIKMQSQFKSLLKESNLLNAADGGSGENRDDLNDNNKNVSSAERLIRKGELKKLKTMKFEHKRQSGKNGENFAIKLNADNYTKDNIFDSSDFDIQDIDFQIKTDNRTLFKLLKESNAKSEDVKILKLIICSGLYPQLAISDVNNTSKSKDLLYHTASSNFVSLHPTSVFSQFECDPLQVKKDEIVDPPPAYYDCSNGSTKLILASVHRLLLYQSLLKVKNICYLTNNTIVSAIHCLLLFSRKIATNRSLTRFVFDDFFRIDLPIANEGKVILLTAIRLRKQWCLLLTNKFQTDSFDQKQLNEIGNRLFDDLLNFCEIKVAYTIKRLLKADLKIVYENNNSENETVFELLQQNNIFDCDFRPLRRLTENAGESGIQVNEYLLYNCIRETDWSIKVGLEMENADYFCENCLTKIDGNLLTKWIHENQCR